MPKAVGLSFCFLLFGMISAKAISAEEQIADFKKQKNDAIFQVEHIVNQPITHLRRTPGMDVSIYSPGWFHPGAEMPDFDTVDVRKTQQLDYLGHKYVTSDLNPGEAFLGDELEFNSMTKYFYTDRSLPKKKLTEAEMLQINDLYRVIGRCNQQLGDLQNPEPLPAKLHRLLTIYRTEAIATVAFILVLLIVIRKRQSNRFEN